MSITATPLQQAPFTSTPVITSQQVFFIFSACLSFFMNNAPYPPFSVNHPLNPTPTF